MCNDVVGQSIGGDDQNCCQGKELVAVADGKVKTCVFIHSLII